MNYYKPRQRESDKRWDYTCRNDDRIWPVGYCDAYKPIAATATFMTPEMIQAFNETEASMSHKYHAGGHETAEEAAAC